MGSTESPFTDIASQGPDQVFDEPRVERQFRVVEEINRSAVA
jgi:type I restriction enzyme R subunit